MTSSWFFLSTLNYDARSTTHQFYYLHRLKIINEPTCPSGNGDQTTDHSIYACESLTKERDNPKKTAVRTNKWPVNKRDLIRRHYNEFINFINEIQFDKMNVE